MPRNILIDLNIILDVFLKREGFEDSLMVIQLGEQTDYKLFVSSHMVTTLAYLLKVGKVPKAKMMEHISWTIDSFSVVSNDDQLLKAATLSRITDYEDAVVEQAALKASAEIIVTANYRDFRDSTVPAMTAKQYLKTLVR